MRLRIAVAKRVCAASVQRPRSVPRPLERERVKERARVLNRVLVFLILPLANARRTYTAPASRSTSSAAEEAVRAPPPVGPLSDQYRRGLDGLTVCRRLAAAHVEPERRVDVGHQRR